MWKLSRTKGTWRRSGQQAGPVHHHRGVLSYWTLVQLLLLILSWLLVFGGADLHPSPSPLRWELTQGRTDRDGLLRPPVQASGTVPFVFAPVKVTTVKMSLIEPNGEFARSDWFLAVHNELVVSNHDC